MSQETEPNDEREWDIEPDKNPFPWIAVGVGGSLIIIAMVVVALLLKSGS